MSASSGQVRVSAVVDEVRSRIAKRTARVGVIGLGYVGLPLALRLSEERFPVTGFDIDQEKVRILSEGGSYIHRIPRTQIQAALAQGFSATSDFGEIARMDAVLICVPTPLTSTREPDLSAIRATAEAVARHVHAGQLIVLESTTYPGTTEEFLVPILEQNPVGLRVSRPGMTGNNVFFVAFSPEREDPGNETVARRSIPKVVGGVDEAATQLAAELYGGLFDSVVPVSTAAAAEMTKLLENIYRCVNIALVNELKLLCLRMGIDIWEVIAAAATKPFGFQPFYPGPGLGGHCIPVDPFYLSWRARQYDFQTKFIELAGDVNTAMPYHVVESVSRALNEHKKALKGSRILILGMAYKKDVDDLRESPALAIIELLRQHGADVSYNDPYFPKVTEGRRYSLHMHSVPLEKLGQYDCVVIVTDHSDYDYARIVRESQLVVDTRNATRGIQGSNIVRC
jgi:UDP-N-acetyl-D-glucosamine dehydrogenase